MLTVANPSAFCLRQNPPPFTQGRLFSPVGKSYASIVDDEKTALAQRDKCQKTDNYMSALEYLICFTIIMFYSTIMNIGKGTHKQHLKGITHGKASSNIR